MKKSESATRARPVLLVGAGRRPNELAAVMAALGAVRARMGGEATEPHRPMGLEDLEELLAERPTEGTLILDYGRVPGEDIGFVRRFLERHPGWDMVVVGSDAQDPRAEALLGLPRSSMLSWPPDLDQVGDLLQPRAMAGSTSPAAPDGRPTPASSVAARAAPREPRDAKRRSSAEPPRLPGKPEHLNVGRLLEELVAGATLGSEASPGFLFRCDATLLVQRERAPLAEALTAFLALARRCAGEGDVVSAQADPVAPPADDTAPQDLVRVRIDFPRGELQPVSEPLASEGWQQLLVHGAPASGAQNGVAEALAAARRAADRLRAIGARVALQSSRAERLTLDLYIATLPLEPFAEPQPVAEPRAEPEPEHAPKAEDPFA